MSSRITFELRPDPVRDLQTGLTRRLNHIERQANALMRRRTHGGTARMSRRFDRIGELWVEYRHKLRVLNQLHDQQQAAD
jgi:hypothetical protein